MKLTLSLKGPPRFEGANQTHVLEEGSAIIGRAPDADWSLPDPERIVSKMHCRIDAERHGFVVTDISTNGAFVNDESIGYERKRLLADGDRLRLGDAVIAVSVEKGRETQEAVGSAFLADGPFGNSEPANHQSVSPSPAEGIEELPGLKEPVKEDWWAGPAPDLPVAATKGVDSGDRAHVSGASAGLGSSQSISPTDAIVMSLVQSFPNLDVGTLASAVDTAGALMPEAEWQGFYERLRAFLRERYPDSR